MKMVCKWLLIFLTGLSLGFTFAILCSSLVYSPGSSLQTVLPTILLDPGHGGWDGGTHDHNGFKEKDIVLQFGFLLQAELQQLGFPVSMTRTTDRELSEFAPYQGTRQRTDLLARTRMVTQYDADLLISLHVNAASNRNLCGAIVFYQRKSNESKKLAKQIQDAILPVQPYNRQTILPGNFYILNASSVPAVLLEIAFISNPHEYQLLKSSAFLQQMANVVAGGIYQYVLETKKPAWIRLFGSAINVKPVV